jgi:hypothetical protein
MQKAPTTPKLALRKTPAPHGRFLFVQVLFVQAFLCKGIFVLSGNA